VPQQRLVQTTEIREDVENMDLVMCDLSKAGHEKSTYGLAPGDGQYLLGRKSLDKGGMGPATDMSLGESSRGKYLK
jgi:hypothetical protein